MTPTPEYLAALERVVEAARRYQGWMEAPLCAYGAGHGSRVKAALDDALSALPPQPQPQQEGERSMEVAVWANKWGRLWFCIPGSDEDHGVRGTQRLGTARMVIVPGVRGEVEG